MKIGLASDHGGFELKEIIKKFLYEKGFEVLDYGTFNGDESVDYPDYTKKAVIGILNHQVDRAIIMCGSGIGISISANKFPGIRAALCWDTYSAKMSRLHNDANVLAMGGRIIGPELAKEIVETWLSYDFEGGRHQRRVDKIDSLAKEYWNNKI